MKLVFLDTDTLGNTDFYAFHELGDFTSFPLTSHKDRVNRCKGMDIVITNKVIIDRELMDACPDLKLVCLAATGMNNVDLAYAAQKNIMVKNVAGYSTDSVVQTTFGMMLSLVCQLPYYDHYVKSGEYSKSPIFTHYGREFDQLASMQVGIIGLGKIGRKVAEISSAFGAHVAYYSTTGKNSDPIFKRVELEDLLRSSDIVSIHAPLNPSTQGLINKNNLAWMKKTSYILNLGRGGIIVEEDLAEAIDNGRIAGAALDVFGIEPLPADHRFLHLKHPERVIFAPHIAWASREARNTLVKGIVKNILDFQKNNY